MSNDMDYKVILTAPEVELLQAEIEITEKRLELAELQLKHYKLTQKVHVGDDIPSPDGGCVEDANVLREKLLDLQTLAASYELANPESDAVEIGSYVVCYNELEDKVDKFFIIQSSRFKLRSIDDYKVATKFSPAGDALKGKRVGDAYSYQLKNATVYGTVAKVENVKQATNEHQKQKVR